MMELKLDNSCIHLRVQECVCLLGNDVRMCLGVMTFEEDKKVIAF